MTRDTNGFKGLGGNSVELHDLYVDSTGDWEPWQVEYRFGAFYLFPPPGVAEPIDALRLTYDPVSAATCQAHISLSEPLPAPMSPPQVSEVRAALSAIAPFDVRYGPLRDFLPYPGVCYAVMPEDRIDALRETIHATSIFTDVVPRRAHIAPHITIAEFISVEQTVDLLQRLRSDVPEGTFRCDAMTYAVPDANFHFRSVMTFRLGG